MIDEHDFLAISLAGLDWILNECTCMCVTFDSTSWVGVVTNLIAAIEGACSRAVSSTCLIARGRARRSVDIVVKYTAGAFASFSLLRSSQLLDASLMFMFTHTAIPSLS